MCNTVNAGMRNRCFKVLLKLSHVYGIFTKSYHLLGLVLSDTIPYASGGYADVWKGQVDGRQVSVKAFRTQTTANLERIKRVCDNVLTMGECGLIVISDFIARS